MNRKSKRRVELITLNSRDTGYRFVDLSSMKQAFKECNNCDTQSTTKRHFANLKIKWNVMATQGCYGYKSKACLCCISGCIWTGIGRERLATICGIFNMPQPMSAKAWNDHWIVQGPQTSVENHFQSTRERVVRRRWNWQRFLMVITLFKVQREKTGRE